MLVPEALAYATIAGVPPVVGLYAAVPALLLYPVFGSSRHLVVAPMSATAALSASVVGGLVAADSGEFVAYTAGLALAVAVVAVAAGLLRLGFLANFISEPVLKGFIVGVALVIMVGQLPALLGIDGGKGDFFRELWDVATSLAEAHGWSVAVGLLCLALILLLRQVAAVVPSSLVAVVTGILLAVALDLEERGVAVVGEVGTGLPSLRAPDVASGDIPLLLSGAVAVMLVGFVEGLGAAKSYARQHRYRVDPNRELIGVGLSNAGAGICSGMVVNGSLSKTAVNGAAGGRTQVVSYVLAALTVLTLLFLTPVFEPLPQPTLAAVVIAAVVELVDVPGLRRLYRVSTDRLTAIYGAATRADFICAVAAMLGVLVFDSLPGLVIGVSLSVLLLLQRSSRPHLAVLGRAPGPGGQWAEAGHDPEVHVLPRVVVVRVESGLFFANADNVGDRLRELALTPGVEALVFDASAVPVIDVTAAHMLRNTADELEQHGIRFIAVGSVGQVRDVLHRAGATAVLRRVFPTIDEAVAAVVEGDGREGASPG